MRLSIFTHPDFGSVRVRTEEGKPLFVAVEVARSLGYAYPANAIQDHCKGVVVLSTPTAGGNQDVRFIPESDLYRLIMRSKLPSAERFQDWVVEEVLPAIREKGSFGVSIPNTLPEALRLAADLAEKNAHLALENAELKPKADFHDAVTASDDVTKMAIAAQVLNLPFGANTLFQRLRNRGVLISGGDRHNMPKQRYVEQGLFTVKETSFQKEGETHVRFTTLVTQKGMA
jgi:anti-repressor protein